MSFCHFTKWLFLAELSEKCYDDSFHRIIPRSSALGALGDQGLLEVCFSSHSSIVQNSSVGNNVQVLINVIK